ncbi:MAG: Kelch repeat-containing protein [Candidatus Muiribacteriota bacterium]
MIKKTLVLFIVFIISFISYSDNLLYQSQETRPGWITSPPENSYTGIYENALTLEEGIKKAIRNAMSYVMMNVGVTVSTELELETQVTGIDTIHNLSEKLETTGQAEIRDQRIQNIYYEKYGPKSSPEYRVFVLLHYPQEAIYEARKWVEREINLIEKNWQESKKKIKELKRNHQISDCLQLLSRNLTRALNFGLENIIDEVSTIGFDIISNLEIKTQILEDSIIKVQTFYNDGQQSTPQRGIFLKASFVKGEGIISPYMVSDRNGEARIKARFIKYQDNEAELEFGINLSSYQNFDRIQKLNQIVQSKKLVKTLQRPRATIVIFPFEETDNLQKTEVFSNSLYDRLLTKFTSPQEIRVLDYKNFSEYELEKGVEADFIIKGKIKNISDKYKVSARLMTGQGEIKDNFTLNIEKENVKNKTDIIFDRFIKHFLPDFIYLQKVESNPPSIILRPGIKQYSLQNLKVREFYSDGRKKESTKAHFEIISGEAELKNKLLHIKPAAEKIVIGITVSGKYYTKKTEFKIIIDAEAEISLVESLNTSLFVQTDGDKKWFGQTEETQNGLSAARSPLLEYGKSYIETEVEGPGILSFFWKTNSLKNIDLLMFYINNRIRDSKTGKTDWEYRTFEIPEGTHSLKWEFEKHSSVSPEESYALLDKLSFDLSEVDSSGYKWRQITEKAEFSPRQGHAVTVWNNKIYLTGGEVGSSRRRDVWASEDGIEWNKITSNGGFAGRKDHALVQWNNRLWISGGYCHFGRLRSDVWSSADGKNWEQVTQRAPWDARQGHSMVVFDDKLWVFGGKSSKEFKNDIWVSENGRNWTQVHTSKPFKARGYHGTAFLKDKIIIAAGESNQGNLNDFWISQDIKNWELKSGNSGFNIRKGLEIESYNSKIWMVGGESGSGQFKVYYNDIWYTDNLNSWIKTVELPDFAGRSGHEVIRFKDNLYIIGGRGSRARLNDVWKLSLD